MMTGGAPIAVSDVVSRGMSKDGGIPLGGRASSGDLTDLNKVASDGDGLTSADEITDSNLSPGLTGELLLDTLLLRNWFQIYLSTEMKHASRGRDQIQDMRYE